MPPSSHDSAKKPDYKVERFGPYEVHQRLGIGGMATVHLALERGVEGFEKWVALKRLLPHLGEDEEFVRSFVREAQLASRLTHANIVRIGQLGKVADDYFISMEYIEGRDVRALLRRARKVAGPPPLTVLASLLLELLDALDYAHRKTDDSGRPLGLVHRDISPSNLLVNVNGHLKIIDFGIAKATAEKGLTQTGKIKGKLAYISPEVLRGKQPDARSDLFSVGIIAHELLTARPLFASKNDYKTIQRIQNAEVLPPSALNTSCPTELDAWVLKALAKSRDKRWGSAREMISALETIIGNFHLHATSRDVATWVEWACSLPLPPKGKPASGGHTRRPPRTPTVGAAEEELLDIIWGTHGGPRAPLNLDEVAAQIANHPEIDSETDPAAIAPTALLFAVGPAALHSESADATFEWVLGEEFESTEPNGLVGPGDETFYGTIDLGGDDWLSDEPNVAQPSSAIDSALFSESELTALSEPLGGGNPKVEASLLELAAEKSLFDDTEPSTEALIAGMRLPPPVMRRPNGLSGLTPDASSADSQHTAVRPASLRARGTDADPRTDSNAGAAAAKDAANPSEPSPKISKEATRSEPTPKIQKESTPPKPSPKIPKEATPPEPSPKIPKATASEPSPKIQNEATPSNPSPEIPKEAKKTTLRGIKSEAPPRANPVDVVLLEQPKRRKRITAKTSVPPLPEPEEPTVTLTRAALEKSSAPTLMAMDAPAKAPAPTLMALDVPASPEKSAAPAPTLMAMDAPASPEKSSAPTLMAMDAPASPEKSSAPTLMAMDAPASPAKTPAPTLMAMDAPASPEKSSALTLMAMDAPASPAKTPAPTQVAVDVPVAPESTRAATPTPAPTPALAATIAPVEARVLPERPIRAHVPSTPGAPRPATPFGDGPAPTVTEAPSRNGFVAFFIVLAVLSMAGGVLGWFLTRPADRGVDQSGQPPENQPAKVVNPGVSTGDDEPTVTPPTLPTPPTPPTPPEVRTPPAASTPPSERKSMTPRRLSTDELSLSIPGTAIPNTAKVKICLDRQGGVQSVRTLEPVARAVEIALTDSVAKWRYEPYRQGGKPVVACFEDTLTLK